MRGNRVGLFYVFTALFWAAMYAYMPFMTPFALSLGAAETFAGLIVGSYGLVQMCLRVPFGIFSDRLRRRKPFVLLGVGAVTLAAAGMYLFTTPTGLLGFRAFAGVAAAAWVPITVLFSSYFDPEQAPRAMGKLNACNTIGIMLASFAGARVAQAMGERAAFLLAAGLGACALVIGLFLRENRPSKDAKPIAVGELLRVGLIPALLSASLIALMTQLIAFGTTDSFTQQWAVELGATTAQLGLMSFAVGIPFTAASMLGGGLLIKRFAPRVQVVFGALCIAAAVVCIPFAPNVPTLLCIMALQGLGGGLCVPMLMSLSILTVSPEKRGVAMGFFQSIYALGMFLGPVLSGAVSQAVNLRACFFVMSGVAVLMALLASVLIRHDGGRLSRSSKT